MKKDGCPYCQQGEFLNKFGVLAFELYLKNKSIKVVP